MMSSWTRVHPTLMRIQASAMEAKGGLGVVLTTLPLLHYLYAPWWSMATLLAYHTAKVM